MVRAQHDVLPSLPGHLNPELHHAQVPQKYIQVAAVGLAFGWVFHNLNSTNGTFLNGQPVGKAELKDADVVLVGKHSPEFREAYSTSTQIGLAQASCPSSCSILK